MRTLLAHTLTRVASWLRGKAGARRPGPFEADWAGWVDLYRRVREPSSRDLLAELKNTAWACASVNAGVCASYYPRLFVATHDGQPQARCLTAALDRKTEERIRSDRTLPVRTTKAQRLEEVLDHPLLRLFTRVNSEHNAFDLWEMTTLYQEVSGSCYWKLDCDALGVPETIWVLPSHQVRAVRKPGSANVVDGYEYRNGTEQRTFPPDEVIHFKYPDPRNPYGPGLAPLRACYESALLTSHYNARRLAIFDNDATPSALLFPEEQVGEEERDRLERQWNQKFRHGGAGKVLVAETRMRLELLERSMGDLAQLAEQKATKEDIANAFHVPLSYLTADTNLANLQAAEQQHRALAIAPRLRRRDEKLNECLIPHYDPTGRLFVLSDDPVPAHDETALRYLELALRYGLKSINEVRQERGEPPVTWGHVPWLPAGWVPTDFPNRPAYAPDTGRTREPDER
jgi:HK97 family phage portal protein